MSQEILLQNTLHACHALQVQNSPRYGSLAWDTSKQCTLGGRSNFRSPNTAGWHGDTKQCMPTKHSRFKARPSTSHSYLERICQRSSRSRAWGAWGARRRLGRMSAPGARGRQGVITKHDCYSLSTVARVKNSVEHNEVGERFFGTPRTEERNTHNAVTRVF